MRLKTPISSISYNTDEFFVGVLNGLIDEHLIDFWAYINHLADTDNGKAHKHLYVVPSRLLDTNVFSDRFKEPDLLCPEKPPLSTKAWRRSKFVDWYLYALHDEDYLSKIGQEPRKFHYTKDEIIVSDEDYFNDLIHTSDFSKYQNISKVRDAVKSGASFCDLVKNGHVPIQYINQWEKFYKIMRIGDFEPLSGGGGSSKGVPFMGTHGEPAQGEFEYEQCSLLKNDFDSFVDSDGEICVMKPVYGDYDLPFKNDDLDY